MQHLINEIRELQSISEGLEPREKERQLLLEKVSGYAHQFLKNIKDRPGYAQGKVEKDLGIKDRSTQLAILLDLYDSEVANRGIYAASGGHLGYIPGGGLYASALADYLAAVTNEYAGIYFGSPGAVSMENEVINWAKDLFGFPESAVGNLASGGSIANLIALTAARDKHKIKGTRIENSVIYLSPQVHHCINKAIRIIGLEDIQVRKVDLDDKHKMKPDHLAQLIEADKSAGLNPFCVIASAGTTDTGAVDPLDEIGQLCRNHKMWFHIDAAYGGFFYLLDEKKPLFSGIEMADSLVVDPHKGLFLPYGVGIVLVKDAEALMHSHHYLAPYMQDTFEANLQLNPADTSPELTKHFRGLRVWLPLQLHGIAPFKACLREKLLLTKYFRHRLEDLGFETGPDPDLSVSYFWHPKGNAYNKQLLEKLHKDGRVFLSSTTLNDRFVIRMAILSFRTKLHTIDRAIKMIEEAM